MEATCRELVPREKVDSQGLKVVETNPQTDPRWLSFVVKHPHGSIYHHPAWLKALEREYRQKGLFLTCEDSSGQILGILPLIYTRGLPLSFGGPLTGRRLSSLPRTPIAGPLSIDSQATIVLLREALKRVSQNPGIHLQIKTEGPELDGLVDGIVCMPWRLSYVLPLVATPDGCFRVADSDHRYTIKKAINKATRLGVRVRPAETVTDLHAWYLLYLDTMRRNLVPARPYRFFVALWELLQPKGLLQLLLADRLDAGKSRIIAGTIFLKLAPTVSCAFNGSSSGDLSLRPNDVIYWHAINDACRQGFRFFDFGEVADERPELARYKIKWGSEAVRLYRYYYPSPRDREIGVLQQHSPKMAGAVWRRLPLSVTAYLSDRVYSYL